MQVRFALFALTTLLSFVAASPQIHPVCLRGEDFVCPPGPLPPCPTPRPLCDCCMSIILNGYRMQRREISKPELPKREVLDVPFNPFKSIPRTGLRRAKGEKIRRRPPRASSSNTGTYRRDAALEFMNNSESQASAMFSSSDSLSSINALLNELLTFTYGLL
ncbi:hypothetical protein M422DRAFT_42339 [Sphaerobolus stellatus SS14]|nr:hypothetical protein M422DRAFT_42339 [Sphaerobolus stellatus SS14]